MFETQDRKVLLAIFAHPDDAELSCGGTISRLAHEGFNCYVLTLTKGEKGNTNEHDRYVEAKQSASLMGFNLIAGNFSDGKVLFNIETISCIDNIIGELNPSILITHYPQIFGQGHQDHLNTSQATLNSALRHDSVQWILYAEPPTYCLDYIPNCFVDVTNYFEIKLNSLSAYSSQKSKPYKLCSI